MSAITVDDELLTLSILYPGYKKDDTPTRKERVEIFNRVRDITYKITFLIKDYPKSPAKYIFLN